MVESLSPLGSTFRPGSHGNYVDGIGAVLSECSFGSIVEVKAWPGKERRLLDLLGEVTRLALPEGAGRGIVSAGRAAFGIGPGKFLLRDEAEDLARALRAAVAADVGTVVDLSHGRTALRIEGARAEWVLAKLYAIDFALPAFPVYSGKATTHHDIQTLIQRTGEQAFDLFVFRSFARSFWKTLCTAAEEVGYEVR